MSSSKTIHYLAFACSVICLLFAGNSFAQQKRVLILVPPCMQASAVNNALDGSQNTAAVIALVCGLVADGTYSLLDGLYVFATSSQANALKNWAGPSSHNLTLHGTCTFTAGNGFTGDASSCYLDPSFIPSSAAGRWAQNSASFGSCILTYRTTATNYIPIGGSDGASHFAYMQGPRNSGGNIGVVLNNSTQTNIAAASSQGSWVASRTGASVFAAYKNAANIGNPNTTSTGMPTVSLSIMADNNNGTQIQYTADQVAYSFFGAGLSSTQVTAVYNRLAAYLQAVSAPSGCGNIDSRWVPGITSLNDGSMVGCYSRTPSSVTLPSQASAVVNFVTVSAVGTISAPIVQFTPPSGRSYNGCDLSITPDGTKLLLLTMNANNAFTAGNGLLFVGTVGGGNVVTWDNGTNITANTTGTFATAAFPTPSKVLVLDNGDWLSFIYNGIDAAVIKCASCNAAAQVWSAQIVVKAGDASCNAWTEMDAVQLTSTVVYATIRCDSGPLAGLSSVTSANRGGAWTVPVSIYPGTNPGKGALVRDPTNDHMAMLTRNPVGGATARGTSVDGAGVSWSALTTINSASAYASGVYKSTATSNWLVGINGGPGDAGTIVQFQSYAIP